MTHGCMDWRGVPRSRAAACVPIGPECPWKVFRTSHFCGSLFVNLRFNSILGQMPLNVGR